MKCRAGFNLIEVLITITLSGVVLGTAAMTLHAVYRTDRLVDEQVVYRMTLHRLSLQLRADCHLAVAVSLDGASARPNDGVGHTTSQQVELQQSDQRRVHYQLQDGVLERALVQDGSVVRRETYRLPEESHIAWQLEPSANGDILVLLVRRGNGIQAATESERIEAAIGIHTERQEVRL